MEKSDQLTRLILEQGGVYLTGTYPEMSREELLEACERLGLKLHSSPSRRVSFCVAGDSPNQEKLDRAKALGLPIFTSSEFLAAIGVVS